MGLATGKKSGVIVVDVDDLSVELPADYLETFTVRTNRGKHLYFVAPEGIPVPTLTAFPVEGTDLRGDGGYVVIEGLGYSIENDVPPAPCPKSLLEAIAKHELKRSSKKTTSAAYTVDLRTPLGQKMLRAATEDAKTLSVGEPGNRDDHLFTAALQLVCTRGMPQDKAVELLVAHYCPRVSEDGRDTVAPKRVEYKCQEASEKGAREFVPFTDEDVAQWVKVSRSVHEAERRETWGLVSPEKVVRPALRENYRPLKSKDLVPATSPRETGFGDLTNILATHDAWAGRLTYDEFGE